jgi:hypothetical protein
MPLLRLAPWAIHCIHWAIAVGLYPTLPPRIPRHLDLGGTVTAMGATSWASWFGLPLVAVATSALLAGLSAALPRHPDWYNFPDKERFLRLPRAAQAPVVALMRSTLDLTATGVALVMALGHALLWYAARGPVPAAAHVMLLLLTVLLGPGILVSTSRLSAAVDAAERELPR